MALILRGALHMIRYYFLLCFLLLPTTSPLASEKPTFKSNGRTFSITGFVEIKADGKIIFSDKKLPWTKQNSYSHLSLGSYTFITVSFNDGADIDYNRLFSVKGNKVTEYPILTSHEESELFIKSGKLYYWSASFCGFKDPRNKADPSYVLVLQKGKFERRPVRVPLYHNCKADFIKKQL